MSVRLGLIQVLCKNHVKTMSSIKTEQTNNLFQVYNIDGKTRQSKRSSSEPKSGRRSKSESFQDSLSRPQSVTGQNEHERTEQVPFKTLNVKRSTCTVRILAYKANLAHFRTIIHDDRNRNGKISSFQDIFQDP